MPTIQSITETAEADKAGRGAAADSPLRPWPADHVERWPVERLRPYAKNARVHTNADVDAVAASMRQWGITAPLMVDEGGEIIYGHCRWLAAHKLRLASVPVVVARGWSEAEKDAYRLADNQLAARASWDIDLLAAELRDLRTSQFDVDLIGFDPDQLAALLAASGTDGLTDPDSVPKPPEVPVTRLHDTWRLGSHRVHCGDCTEAHDVAAALAGVKPHLMVTDPPYGVGYDPAWRDSADLGVGKRSKGMVLNDDRADWREAWALFPGEVAYVWHASLHGGDVADGLQGCGFQIRSQLVWVKQHFALSRGDYHWQHESCWYAVREGAIGHWMGGRSQSTVWEIANNNAFGNRTPEQTWGHGTQKPVECMRRPILNNSQPGQAVYDPFLGSGTTVIAAEMMGRACLGLELNPAYVDVVVQRWEAFTGLNATLDATGEIFRDRAAPN